MGRKSTNTEGKSWARYLRLSKTAASEDSGKSKAERLAACR